MSLLPLLECDTLFVLLSMFVIGREQQPAMLETLLKHLDTAAAAATNGSAEAPAADKTAEEPKKDEAAAPAEEVRRGDRENWSLRTGG